jgi:hypothetical protein
LSAATSQGGISVSKPPMIIIHGANDHAGNGILA